MRIEAIYLRHFRKAWLLQAPLQKDPTSRFQDRGRWLEVVQAEQIDPLLDLVDL